MSKNMNVKVLRYLVPVLVAAAASGCGGGGGTSVKPTTLLST